MRYVMANKEDKKKYPEVNMPCQRGKDQLTKGSHCDSKMAYNMSEPGSRMPSFKCVKCGFTWMVPMGGSFMI
jgi:transposase-like protein